MKKLILLPIVVFLLSTMSAFSQTRGSSLLSVEPIVGYERVQALLPEPHTKDRLIYGLRVSFGPPILSIEAEATQGSDTESFPSDNLEVKESVTNGMVGLKSSIFNGQFLRWYIRAGGHARKTKIETTLLSVTTTEEPDLKISPYAGTGLTFRFGSMFTLNAGITAIFTGEPNGSDREYQTTLGFSIRI